MEAGLVRLSMKGAEVTLCTSGSSLVVPCPVGLECTLSTG